MLFFENATPADDTFQNPQTAPRLSESNKVLAFSKAPVSGETDGGIINDKWWALRKIGALSAWQFSVSKGAGQTIALVGASCAEHPELEGTSLLEASKDNIRQARVGTCLASIAVSRQAGEIVGSAPSASIFSTAKSGRSFADEIEQAIFRGAGAILVAEGAGLKAADLHAIENAKRRGAVVIVGAGEDDGSEEMPATFVVVAGSNYQDKLWTGSRTGPDIAFAAPAQSVWGAAVGSDAQVCRVDGTAGAAALVAGVCALWRAHHGDDVLSDFVKNRSISIHDLFQSAVGKTARCPNHWDEENCGAGIIDANALLRLPLDIILQS
ncbi:S8 family serine peptidase [Pseudahrensia aquimaris]|uniref:S8 family serine peptidase n=1 Tax=Pseudahrensia aquimaris TaxID=744461 RepID=A0ABW3FE70_9HYPH